jgi:hypothetical protein
MDKSKNVFAFFSVPLVFPLFIAQLPARAIEIPPSNRETPVWHQSTPISQNLVKESIWAGYPLLKRICGAESAGGPENQPKQFDDDGTPNWGWDHDPYHPGKWIRVERDVGDCQINILVHSPELKNMGLNVVHNEADNITFAKWLYDREGWRPWIASKTMPSGNGWDEGNLIH